ncbi:MAG: hypothetical protein H6742_16510 [Alphaproteobacteria bacterium]|nr:hypothetical protein [Alphaproteobacteria bacterium]
MRSRHALTALLGPALLALGGCNQYELFALAGYEQASFNNQTDVVFIVDNSSSMQEEASALATNFDVFLAKLADPGAGGTVSETLTDAVGDYASYSSDRTSVLDYQLAITTTTAEIARGPTTGLDDGEAGSLVGDVIVRGSNTVKDDFLDQLLCDTVNWNAGQLPDVSYECGGGTPDEIGEDYLNCVCGDRWKDNSGGGNEEPLEAALYTLCRSNENPPDICFHEASDITTADIMSEPDLVRDDSTVVFVLITDEGDVSRQLATGDDDPSPYLSAYESFDAPVRWAVIGPRFDPESGDASACSLVSAGEYERESVPYWSTNRLYLTANGTGGFYQDITSGSGDVGSSCGVADFSVYLEQLGDLLVNLVNAFALRSIPDVSTLRVFVDKQEVGEATLLDTDGDRLIYSDGWSYDAGTNAVVFWGNAVPDYNADVEIYYRPLEGKPRELPF